MKNSQKGFIKGLVIAIVIVFLLGLAVIGFLLWQTKQALDEARSQTLQTTSSTSSVVSGQDTSVTLKTVPMGWKEYTSDQYGISFAYPANWTLSSDTAGNQVDVTVNAPRQNINAQYGNALIDSSWKISIAKQCEGKTCNSSPLTKNVVFDNATTYEITFDSVTNGRYALVTELWGVNGNSAAATASTKSSAAAILDQITSTMTIK